MAARRSSSDLREFVKENERRIYDFCFFMGLSPKDCDDILIDIFRDFGDTHKKVWGAQGQAESFEKTLALFRLARVHIERQGLVNPSEENYGRDTRYFPQIETDLLAEWDKHKGERDWANTVVDRLRQLELDFRFPVVIRDLLKFEDEEVAQILGLRWGVYRQRLHRGRRECAEKFRGPKPYPTEPRRREPQPEPRRDAT